MSFDISTSTNYDKIQDARYRAGEETAVASGSVTYSPAFSQAPFLIIGQNQAGVVLTGQTATGFTYTASNLPNTFDWFAILI